MVAAAEAAYSTMFYACAAMTLLALAAAVFLKELPLRTGGRGAGASVE
jgi:hypothetical protein